MKPRIILGIPSGVTVYADLLPRVVGLVQATLAAGISLSLSCIQSADPARSRNLILQDAAKSIEPPTHIMWIDADMLFLPNVITKLLAHDKDIVGATYPSRTAPHGPLHVELIAHEQSPLRRVKLLPGGMRLVKYEVYSKVGLYRDRVDLSHDYGFCLDAAAAGYEIWMDAQLSREVAHVGLAYHAFRGR